MTTQTNRKPTHGVFHVREGGQKGYWTKIGAAWLHDDKEGLNLSLDYLPLPRGANDKSRIVVRINKPEDATQGEAA